MKYRGLIKRVFYTNVGVEAQDLDEARRKVRDLAEVMEPDCYDYEEPLSVYVNKWTDNERWSFFDQVERKDKRDAGSLE